MRKPTGGANTGYVWDGDDLAVEVDGAGALVRAYSYYPGVDQPHSVTQQGGKIFRYTPELPGHVAGLVGAGDTVANAYTYTPFGEPLSTNEQVPQPLRYMAREYDAETGLYYVRARYYDPQQGRFVSEDPIRLAGGINPYAYVSNDPVNLTDPSGLDPCGHATAFRASVADGVYIAVKRCPRNTSGASANFGNPHARGGLFGQQEATAVPGSHCDLFGCELDFATNNQKEQALRAASRIRSTGFCGQIKQAATEMINRELLIFDNTVRIPLVTDTSKYRPMYGEAPFNPRFGAPVMYLHASHITTRLVAHEGVHGIINRSGKFPSMWDYYADGQITPMGVDVDSTSKLCSRRR